MTTKTEKKGTRKVKALRVKSLAADKAKHIKGGPCPGTNTNLTRLN